MYDTEKRVELVKKRMYEYRRRKERHRVYHLSALCSLLFLSLAAALGTVQIQPMDAAGMYGAILLHEGGGWICAGGYDCIRAGRSDNGRLYEAA